MEYQKIINLFNNTNSQLSKFRTKIQVEMNDGAPGTYAPNNQVRCKSTMLKLGLFDYSDAHILLKGTIAITKAGANE